jgi:hypothetical protein
MMKKLIERDILDSGEALASRERSAEPDSPVVDPPVIKPYQRTMPKLALELNTRVFVNLNPVSNEKVSVQGEFLGAAHFEFMILRLPSIPGLIKKLLPHLRIHVQYHSGGAANKFTAEMISYSVRPTLLLFISYPDRMSVLETRKHQRITCALPVSLATQYGDSVAALRDLSIGGCRLSLEMTGQSAMRRLSIGDRLVLQTPLSANDAPIRCIGIIRSLETGGSCLHIGLAFDENNKTFTSALSTYLELVQATLF